MKILLPIYKSFDEKSEHFQLKIIDTIEQLNETIDNFKLSKGIYRGISSSSYKIYTSLQRQIIENNLRGKFKIEDYIKNFRNHELLKNYFKFFNIVPSKLSIYSYLQHYRAPTPFLDFTKSFEKALYFAIEKFDLANYNSDKSINDYFSIFYIDNSNLDTLSIPQVIEGLKKLKKHSIEALSHYEDYTEEAMLSHIDNMFHINTCEVFLIDNDEKFYDIYNTYNNIRIIAQKGLFIHNDFPDIALEVALKVFFKSATVYQHSPWDEVDTEQSRAINEEYEITLKRNREFQSRLEGNIIKSFEINKSLITEIKKIVSVKEADIYPNSEDICWKIFEQSK